LSCVRELSRSGRWKVFATGTNKERLELLGTLPGVEPLSMDLRSDESVEACKRSIAAQTHGLDAIVNLAGLAGLVSLVEGDGPGEIARLMEVNVLGTARVNRAFFDLIRAGNGKIVNCSSEAGWMKAQPFVGPYYLSKHALETYNDSLRRELMFLGIPVILLRPGSFDTGMTRSIFSSFDTMLADTKLYGEVLRRLRPLMVWELERKNALDRFSKLLLKVLESPRPKPYYSLGTGWALAAMELLPESWVDRLYMILFRLWRKKVNNDDMNL